MEAIGATCALLYGLNRFTDVLKPEVKECLTPTAYTPFTLLEKEKLTHDTMRFRFRINRPRHDGEREHTVDEIIQSGAWAIDVKDHMVQTYRTYTPVDMHMDGERYPRGSLSRFLHGTRVGDQVEMRGPILTMPYKPGQHKHIYMVAGGTGIAPMYQLIDRVLKNPEDKDTKISLLYGSRTEKDIIYREQLDKMAIEHKDRLDIWYMVDQGPTELPLVGYPTPQLLRDFTKGFTGGKDIVLVSGPDPMMKCVSGLRPIGPSQGPLSGILRELGFRQRDVFKF
ncbi:ferredoxin reductase-like protein [Linderina pennispora]|uniref:cytochrome-b5 reductase n=1 Tax=Linderina pennispora TaxID=61395 RepID=A0A1Y1W749_9FUNG|nr:ferredoxin reductase-like protein [Linderina pennispora]ORX69056.1 ferredoxin reductase-like protein [Linderina pennispora]